MRKKEGLESIKGIGSVSLKKLNDLGIFTKRDLIEYFPVDYKNLSNPVELSEDSANAYVVVSAKVDLVSKPVFVRQNFNYFRAEVHANGRKMTITWFNQPYLANRLTVGVKYVFFGKLTLKNGRLNMANPSFEAEDGLRRLRGIIPIYRTKGLFSQSVFCDVIKNCISDYDFKWGDMSDEEAAKLKDAYLSVHSPKTLIDITDAFSTIAADELKTLMYSYRIDRENGKIKSFLYSADYTVLDKLINSLPYELTNSQKEAIRDICTDLHSPHPMNRLLSGDVGSGKTVVAVAAICYTASCGGQSALLAPTEILAYQHYEKIKKPLMGVGFSVECLTSSTPIKQKRAILAGLSDGSIDVVVGTSGIISDGVNYKRLALAVVDESHRFGVRTRATLISKGENTDTLIMTATPIPRAISLLSYGELSVSALERRSSIAESIDTELYATIGEAMPHIIAELNLGRQAYIVCPRVEEDEEGIDISSVNGLYNEIKQIFPPNVSTAYLHGKMKDDEKQKVMSDFATGSISVLVASTVIEVGIDVKNASVMCIMDCARFGMATLHQLRGRVGRGDVKGKCMLICGNNPSDRIKQFAALTDGLKLAELDYKRRGAGDFIGYRQSGASSVGILQTLYSVDMITECKRYVDRLDVNSESISAFLASDKYRNRQTADVVMN